LIIIKLQRQSFLVFTGNLLIVSPKNDII